MKTYLFVCFVFFTDLICIYSHLLQNGSAGWADEADSSRGRGEASRDFAKVKNKIKEKTTTNKIPKVLLQK